MPEADVAGIGGSPLDALAGISALCFYWVGYGCDGRGVSNADNRLFDHRQRCRWHDLRRPIVDRLQCKHQYHRPASHAGRPLERRLSLCPAAPAICVYGVGSRQLGSNRIDVSGLNRGYYELASGPEIVSYFDRLMHERFLPSGRVQYFPMCDHLGDGRFVSLVSGTIQQIAFSKKLVHATFLDTQVPSTHTPSFQVAEGVKLVTPNLLPISAPGHQRYVIVGGGKTAMDVGTWLLQMGVRPENIRWIVPREIPG